MKAPTDPEATIKIGYADLAASLIGLLENPSAIAEAPTGRYALIEESVHTGLYWLTTHATPLAALHYHETQDSPAAWEVDRIVDLLTDEVFPATPTARTSELA